MIKCFIKSSVLRLVLCSFLLCFVTFNIVWAKCDQLSFNEIIINIPQLAVNKSNLKSQENQTLLKELSAVEARLDKFVKDVSLADKLKDCTEKGYQEFIVARLNNAQYSYKNGKADGDWPVLLQRRAEIISKLNNSVGTGTGQACGGRFPEGCFGGKKCWMCHMKDVDGWLINKDYFHQDRYSCEDKDPTGNKERLTEIFRTDSKDMGHVKDAVKNQKQYWCEQVDGADEDITAKDRYNFTNKIVGSGTSHVGTKQTYDQNGNVVRQQEASGVYVPTSDSEKVTYSDKGDSFNRDIIIPGGDNESCHIDQLQESYMGSCYSCVIVSALISIFMQVADKLGPLMQLAGTRLLIIGIPLWLAFYLIQKLVSLVSLEPMEILNDLFKFFFKCLVAYTLITSGVRIISQLMVNPILNAGADYGIGIIDSVMPKNINSSVTSKLNKDSKHYQIAASNNVDQKVFDKIMLISRKTDAAVSLNFVIGNAVFCHSYNAGAIRFPLKLTEYLKINFYFPDFWLMLCGALIWFFAFMVTIGVNFYLLDLSFKIGFALLALPVTIGLWPFEKFKDKFNICIKLIANAAGTFMFLGITTGISIALISASLGGTDKLLDAIKANQQAYVSDVFGFTGAKFLIVFFAFFYSHKLISETVSNLVDKFFDSVLQGATPMAVHATGAVDMAKRGISTVAGGVYGATAGKAVGAAKAAVKRGALNVARKGVQGARAGARAVGRAFGGGGDK